MENLCLKAINEYNLLGGNNRVTVALSGGADSMSLLYALLSLKEKLGITVYAAHLNHLIRGDEAFRDETFVKEVCEKLNVILFCERIDIPKLSKETGQSLELTARKARYEFLERVSSGGLVATAHTASDNFETMLFNLSRGTGLDGLCGIPPKRDIYIRPLICATRADVEKYCAEKGIDFVTDSTNLEDDYSRNKIRHKIVPILKEINPLAEMSAFKTATALRETSQMIENCADDYLVNNLSSNSRLNLKKFNDLDIVVAKKVLVKFAQKTAPEVLLESSHINEIFKIANCGGRTSLPKNYSAVSVKNELYLENNVEIPEFKVEITEKDNPFSENIQKVNNLLLNNYIDCDKIIGKLVLRTRQSGDSMKPYRRAYTKSLNKLFNEYAISLKLRDKLPVISDDKGVVWVYGIGVAQRCAINDKTKKIKEVNVEEYCYE